MMLKNSEFEVIQVIVHTIYISIIPPLNFALFIFGTTLVQYVEFEGHGSAVEPM